MSLNEEEMMEPALRVNDLVKEFRLGDRRIPVLQGLSLEISGGELVVIMGPSGSGKTTLLNCVSAIDTPVAGRVTVGGETVDYSSELVRTRLRRQRIGMVFQFFNLIPTLTARENIELPFLIARQNRSGFSVAVEQMMKRVGLQDRHDHYPHQLSGGEMQLVSIARALVNSPTLLLADEPTGNVNPKVGRSIMHTLREAAKAQNVAVLMVTHSPEHAAWADRVCFLKDGVIAGEHRQQGQTQSVAPIYERLLELDI